MEPVERHRALSRAPRTDRCGSRPAGDLEDPRLYGSRRLARLPTNSTADMDPPSEAVMTQLAGFELESRLGTDQETSPTPRPRDLDVPKGKKEPRLRHSNTSGNTSPFCSWLGHRPPGQRQLDSVPLGTSFVCGAPRPHQPRRPAQLRHLRQRHARQRPESDVRPGTALPGAGGMGGPRGFGQRPGRRVRRLVRRHLPRRQPPHARNATRWGSPIPIAGRRRFPLR